MTWKSVDRTGRRLRRAATLLDHRRMNWRHVAAPRAWQAFSELRLQLRDSNLPFQFFVQHVQTPNEEVIQIRASQTHTGVFNRKNHAPWHDPPYVDTAIWESGGELVLSQSATGHVYFVATPRRSERSTPDKQELILLGPLDPTDVTASVLKKAVKRYMLLLRSTSNFGGADALAPWEWLTFQWTYTWELRERQRLIRSALRLENEWLKAMISAGLPMLLTFLLGLYFGTKSS
ncbi:hypothetical protein ACQ859_11055 [Roseateles chitinivorans]|uniref:hypothetical protein n=1 Tax=Roseateles chitinivorans TaxID=2917965 RepID=UPI003D6791C0